jgi:hypothetical protein
MPAAVDAVRRGPDRHLVGRRDDVVHLVTQLQHRVQEAEDLQVAGPALRCPGRRSVIHEILGDERAGRLDVALDSDSSTSRPRSSAVFIGFSSPSGHFGGITLHRIACPGQARWRDPPERSTESGRVRGTRPRAGRFAGSARSGTVAHCAQSSWARWRTARVWWAQCCTVPNGFGHGGPPCPSAAAATGTTTATRAGSGPAVPRRAFRPPAPRAPAGARTR